MMIEIPLPYTDHIVGDAIRALAPSLSYENGPWIAGGSLRRIIMNQYVGAFDVDVFFPDKDMLTDFKSKMSKVIEEKKSPKIIDIDFTLLKLNDTTHAAMEKINGNHYYNRRVKNDKEHILIQYIDNFFFDNVDKLLNDFDFTVCQLVSDGKTIRFSERTQEHMDNFILSVNNKSKIRNMSRLARYMGMGFYPDETLYVDMAKGSEASPYYQKDDNYESIHVDYDMEKMEQEMALSKISEFHIRQVGKEQVAFLFGAPMPVQLAYILISSPNMRDSVIGKMAPIWNNKVDTASLLQQVTSFTPERFVKEYQNVM